MIGCVRLGWKDVERVRVLRERWVAGDSAEQIAQHLGGITRLAVIGKLNRLRLLGTRGSSAASISAQSKRLAAHSGALKPSPKLKRPPTTAPALVSTPLPPDTDAPGTATVLTLTLHSCRWPVGDPADPSFTFCGVRTAKGPYCPAHSKRAFLPAPKTPLTETVRRRWRRA